MWRELKRGRECNSRESNPGLIRGRDLSYHLTTIALFCLLTCFFSIIFFILFSCFSSSSSRMHSLHSPLTHTQQQTPHINPSKRSNTSPQGPSKQTIESLSMKDFPSDHSLW